MSKYFIFLVILVLGVMNPSFAQNSGWGNALNNLKQTVLQKLTPDAQKTVDAAAKLPTSQEKENFILAKAKEFLNAKNYQTALDLANYVKTNLNAKSLTANKVIEDAKAALTKMAKDKASSLL